MPIEGVSTNLQVAAQYAFDYRLSKPYTNRSCLWDWGYPSDLNGPIWRPNHGLAHSIRGAMYAPTVIDYFKNVTGDPDYDLSLQEIEKIQIALMFRVTGRENDAGFSNDPVAYAEYQKGHAKYFREYCLANPGVFKDDAEIEKYANLLKTYANPNANSPLANIFKTCHNLDLIRVRDPAGLEKELAIPTQMLGDANVKQLMLYADSCIRATGSQINCANPIIGRGDANYEDGIFRVVSTNVAACFQTVANVSKPPKPIVDVIPAAQITATKDALLNYSTAEVQKMAVSLYGYAEVKGFFQEANELLLNIKISQQTKIEIMQKIQVFVQTILKNEIPLSRYKYLVEYLTSKGIADPKLLENPDVAGFANVVNNLQKLNLPADLINNFQAVITQAAIDSAQQIEQVQQKVAQVSVKPMVSVDGASIINQDLFDDPLDPVVADSIKSFADALKQKSIELFLKVALNDLASPQRSDITSVKNLSQFTTKITESIFNDLFKAKSSEHQKHIFQYYCKVLNECMNNKDYNSARAIYQALADPQIQRLATTTRSLASADLLLLKKHGEFFDRKNPAGYHFLKQTDVYIPSSHMLITSLNNSSKQLSQPDKQGAIRVDVKRMTDVGKIYEDFRQCRAKLLTEPVVVSDVELSHIQHAKLTTKEKKQQLSRRVSPEHPFVADSLVPAVNASTGIMKLFESLNDSLTMPINIEFVYNGVKGGNKTFEYLLDFVEIYKDLLLAEHSKSPQPKTLFEKLAILSLSLQEYGDNNKLSNAVTNQRLANINSDLITNGVTPNFSALREGQSRINKFKLGSPSLTELDIPLPAGPLVKNGYTSDYEELMKGMLAGDTFTASVVNQQTIITMNGNSYNLPEIIKYANLNHLELSDADKAAYMDMLNNHCATLEFPPCYSSGSTLVEVRDPADIQQLNATFDVHPELQALSVPERMALNIYTTGFYDDVNPFLRNGNPKNLYSHYLRELICHAGVAIVGLNKISDDKVALSFRAEHSDPNNIPPYMQNRIDAAKTGGVTVEMNFISTAQENPSLDFGDPDTPGGVGIIFKELKGKNVRNLSAYPHEREFLMPPTQIQWISYFHAKQGHILEGKPVATPLNLSPEAFETLSATKKAKIAASDKLITEQIAKATKPMKLVNALNNMPPNLTDNKGNPIDISKMVIEIVSILGDPNKVQAITEDPLAHVPALVQSGIVDKYGILKKFIDMAGVQHDFNEKQKAQVAFEAALNAAPNVDKLIEVINQFAKNSYINMGDAQTVHAMTKQMKEIASSGLDAHEIYDNHMLPFDRCSDILANYNINTRFFELVSKQYEEQLDEAIASVMNASSLNELIDTVRSSFQSGIFDVDPATAKKMIDTMRHYANNAELVHAIAKGGDNALLFKNSGITHDYGIREQFINLAIKQDLKNSFKKNINSAANSDVLIRLLERDGAKLVLEDEEGVVDVAKMVKNMRTMLNEPEILTAIATKPHLVDIVFKNSGVTTAEGIRDKFIHLAKNLYQLQNQQQRPAVTRQKAVTFNLNKSTAAAKAPVQAVIPVGNENKNKINKP